MSSTVLEFVGTKNARLAKFCDNNPEVGMLFMKLVTHIEQVSREKNKSVDGLKFEATGNRDGDMIAVKIRWR